MSLCIIILTVVCLFSFEAILALHEISSLPKATAFALVSDKLLSLEKYDRSDVVQHCSKLISQLDNDIVLKRVSGEGDERLGLKRKRPAIDGLDDDDDPTLSFLLRPAFTLLVELRYKLYAGPFWDAVIFASEIGNSTLPVDDKHFAFKEVFFTMLEDGTVFYDNEAPIFDTVYFSLVPSIGKVALHHFSVMYKEFDHAVRSCPDIGDDVKQYVSLGCRQMLLHLWTAKYPVEGIQYYSNYFDVPPRSPEQLLKWAQALVEEALEIPESLQQVDGEKVIASFDGVMDKVYGKQMKQVSEFSPEGMVVAGRPFYDDEQEVIDMQESEEEVDEELSRTDSVRGDADEPVVLDDSSASSKNSERSGQHGQSYNEHVSIQQRDEVDDVWGAQGESPALSKGHQFVEPGVAGDQEPAATRAFDAPKSQFDEGYYAEDSQDGHSEEEDDLQIEPPTPREHTSNDEMDESPAVSPENVPPAAMQFDPGYDAEDSQGNVDVDKSPRRQKRSNTFSALLDPGYDAEDSQGHTEEEAEVRMRSPSRDLQVPSHSPEESQVEDGYYADEHNTEEESVPKPKKAKVALKRVKSPDSQDEAGYDADGQHTEEEEVSRTEDEGEDAKRLRFHEEDAAPGNERPHKEAGDLPESHTLSDMDAADERTMEHEDHGAESSEIEEEEGSLMRDHQPRDGTKATSSGQNTRTLNDFALAAQDSYDVRGVQTTQESSSIVYTDRAQASEMSQSASIESVGDNTFEDDAVEGSAKVVVDLSGVVEPSIHAEASAETSLIAEKTEAAGIEEEKYPQDNQYREDLGVDDEEVGDGTHDTAVSMVESKGMHSESRWGSTARESNIMPSYLGWNLNASRSPGEHQAEQYERVGRSDEEAGDDQGAGAGSGADSESDRSNVQMPPPENEHDRKEREESKRRADSSDDEKAVEQERQGYRERGRRDESSDDEVDDVRHETERKENDEGSSKADASDVEMEVVEDETREEYDAAVVAENEEPADSAHLPPVEENVGDPGDAMELVMAEATTSPTSGAVHRDGPAEGVTLQPSDADHVDDFPFEEAKDGYVEQASAQEPDQTVVPFDEKRETNGSENEANEQVEIDEQEAAEQPLSDEEKDELSDEEKDDTVDATADTPQTSPPPESHADNETETARVTRATKGKARSAKELPPRPRNLRPKRGKPVADANDEEPDKGIEHKKKLRGTRLQESDNESTPPSPPRLRRSLRSSDGEAKKEETDESEDDEDEVASKASSRKSARGGTKKVGTPSLQRTTRGRAKKAETDESEDDEVASKASSRKSAKGGATKGATSGSQRTTRGQAKKAEADESEDDEVASKASSRKSATGTRSTTRGRAKKEAEGAEEDGASKASSRKAPRGRTKKATPKQTDDESSVASDSGVRTRRQKRSASKNESDDEKPTKGSPLRRRNREAALPDVAEESTESDGSDHETAPTTRQLRSRNKPEGDSVTTSASKPKRQTRASKVADDSPARSTRSSRRNK